ncbi:MAG TPA: endolytic transglycosylase MltG [Actinomycetota bacterium]|nr:endolytic transglycosylase MltG [Actinomycetota bacterium]
MLEETEVHEEPPQPPVPPQRRRGLRVFLVVLLLFILLVGAGAGYVAWAMGGISNGETVRVIIPEGASGSEIASILQREKVVRSGFIFRLIARLRGVSTDLKPGTYELRVGMGVNAALNALKTGVPLKTFTFTIPEGKTIPEIAAIVAEHTPISAAQFLEACRSGRHRLPIMPKNSNNLEGLLFPKTYLVVEKTTADELVDMMLKQFTIDTAGLDFGKATAHHITPYQAVIIASLIEREAKVERDRPLISSVIYNRLARPMRLQIDATVEYAILLQTGHYKYPLTTDDYTNVHSPYNTYLVDGLPPAPIASPGLASLQAALDPANTQYYYYVLTSDQKSHCFATDQAGFNRCRAGA